MNQRVKEIIAFFQDFYEDFDSERAYDMLQKLNINPNDSLKSMSKGTKEKVQLILVMSRKAELYILDEPNSALDSIAEADMLKLYEKIIRNHMGIIVTHKFNVLVKRVDRIVVLSEGVISGIGTHESLLKLNSDYRKMYEAQDITQ